jgi:hypothetical protein
MRLDLAIDDDAAPSPHVLAAKPHALADIDIDASAAPAVSAGAAAASQGQRLLKQMQDKAGGGDRVVVRTLMTKAVPVVKQVR